MTLLTSKVVGDNPPSAAAKRTFCGEPDQSSGLEQDSMLPLKPPRKKRTTSKVWEFFEFDDNGLKRTFLL